MNVFEAMETCRAMRYFKADPVPTDLVDRVLYAATRAPSPGNSQGWDFIVVTDTGTKQRIADAVCAAIEPVIAEIERAATAGGAVDPVARRMLEGAANLARTAGTIPVLMIVCGKAVYPAQAPQETFVWSAIYPAAQNILLAARALGLGTCFTTWHHLCEATFREELGIPDDVHIGAVIPMGWPDAPFGPLARKPVDSFVHRERW